jgi:hypothetical protein
MKKLNLFILTTLAILAFPIISAQLIPGVNLEQGARDLINEAINFGTPFFEIVIGDYSGSEFFFGKILLLILLIIIIKNILDKTPIGENNRNASIVISLIVSILAIRFINENSFFEAIFIQYGVLGIAITTILPMVIFFYFVHNTKVGTFGRKIFWAIYAVTMTGIWISKSSEIPEVANWIYIIIITASVVFIFIDKNIHAYFGLADFKKFEKKQNREAILRAKERLHKLRERLDRGIINQYEYNQGVREEEKLIRELSKE